MKLGSYTYQKRRSYGAFTDYGVVDLGIKLQDRAPTIVDLLNGGIERAIPIVTRAPSYIPLSELEFEPVIPNPGKLIAIGLNTKSHFEEAAPIMGVKEHPSKPWFFLRAADSLAGHQQPIIRPRVSNALDYEGEIAIVIGRRARYVPTDKALSYIAGYTCANEGSVRDYQRHSGLGSAGKMFPKSGSLGPWLVTPDEMPPLSELELSVRVNGERRQRMTIDDLIFSPSHLISYLSECLCLMPGDVIITGSPAGVGALHNPPAWLKAGDLLEVELTGVGVLRNRVADEAESA